MRNVVNIAFIKAGAILLVKKNETWILPGGKNFDGENDFDCLDRELGEELPRSIIRDRKPYKDFRGTSPHRKSDIVARVFTGRLEGEITPAAEIAEARFFSPEEFAGIRISEITTKVLEELQKDGYFQ